MYHGYPGHHPDRWWFIFFRLGTYNGFIDPGDRIDWEPAAESHHLAGIKWGDFYELRKTQKTLAMRVVTDHADGVFIRQAQFFFDDQSTKCNAAVNGHIPFDTIFKVLCVDFVHQIPGDDR